MKGPRLRAALLLLPVLLAVSTAAYAVDPNRALTQYVHRIWQMQQGLPQATIYAIVQDRQGYLWLGTQGGVVRFDGVRFTTLDDPSLRKAWVQSIVEDRDGTVWVGTSDNGLLRLRDGVATRTNPGGVLSTSVHALLVARDGALWVVSDDTGSVTRISRTATRTYSSPLATKTVSAACQADDGTVWFGGAGSELGIWNGAGFARYRIASVPASTRVQAMQRSSDGSLWIGTTDGLVQLKDGRERLITVRDGLADNAVLALAEGRDGALWVGTRNGFSRVRPGDIESFGTSHGLSHSTVYALCEDREGSFWVGTKHGLNQFLDGRTIPFTTNEGLPSNEAGPLLQDSAGVVWAGTLDAGLSRFDGRRFTALTTRDGLASNTVRALAQDPAGNIWVGTERGLNRLRNGRVVATYTTGAGLPANDVRSLFVDRDASVWVGTLGGTAILRGGGVVRPADLDGIVRAPVAAFSRDARGHLVVAEAGGSAYVISDGQPVPLQARNVDAFYQDADGRMWMGTVGNGLWLLEPGRVVSYSMRDGLFDDEIYGITADGADRLWMACSKGIFSVNRTDLLKFAAGSIRSFTSTPYSPTDALRTIQCRPGVQPAVWRMKDGRVWFSTIRGFTVIDPAHLERNLPGPPVVVEEVTVNGRKERASAIHRLPPGANNLDFEYTALSFVVPNRITFRYQLEGFDRRWVNADTRREAIYTNLPPGDFRFRLIACNTDGKCAEARTPIAFSIAPRLYQRAWFLAAVAALVALGAWLGYWLRVRRLRAQFALVLGERNRIARELHDTLIQGFSGITMQLQALLGRLGGVRERRDLEEIIKDAGWCLRDARRSLAGLRSVSGSDSGLPAALVQAARQMTESGYLRLRLRVGDAIPDLPANASFNLLRIAQEAMANAVKHANATTLEVALHATAAGIELSVRDDGEGFDPDEAAYVQLGHYGVVGMRERAREIGAELSIASHPDGGTVVKVTLPLAETVRPETAATETSGADRKTG